MFETDISCKLDTSTYSNYLSILYWMYESARDYEYGSYHNRDAYDDSECHAYAYPEDDYDTDVDYYRDTDRHPRPSIYRH